MQPLAPPWWRSPRALLAIPFVLLVGATLTFADQAPHIDDPLFIAMSDAVLRDPLRPYDFWMNWNQYVEDGARIVANPPLHAYILSAIRLLFGDSVWAMRVGVLPFGLLLLWAVARLARRFDAPPWLAAALVVTMPVFVVMAGSAMPDVVLTSLVAAAMALFLTGVDERRPLWLLGAGVLASLAILTRYNALVILPVWFCYPFLRRGGHRHAWLAIGVALFAFVVWNVITWLQTGEPHFESTLRYTQYFSTIRHRFARLASVVTALGGVTIFPVVLAWAFLPGKRLLLALGAAIAVGLVIAFVPLGGRGDVPSAAIFFLPSLFVAGAVVVVFALASALREAKLVVLRRGGDDPEARHRRDDAFLGLWLLAFLCAPIIYVHTSAKYLLPAAPAIALIFLRRPVLHAGVARVKRLSAAVLSLVLAGSLAFCLAQSNAQVSNGYRDAARALIGLPRPKGRPLWFAGHWGWQYEIERLGAKSLSSLTDDLQEGDIIVVPVGASASNLPGDFFWRASEISARSIRIGSVFRLMHDDKWAGFFSNFFGPLPFSFSNGVVDEVLILRADY